MTLGFVLIVCSVWLQTEPVPNSAKQRAGQGVALMVMLVGAGALVAVMLEPGAPLLTEADSPISFLPPGGISFLEYGALIVLGAVLATLPRRDKLLSQARQFILALCLGCGFVLLLDALYTTYPLPVLTLLLSSEAQFAIVLSIVAGAILAACPAEGMGLLLIEEGIGSRILRWTLALALLLPLLLGLVVLLGLKLGLYGNDFALALTVGLVTFLALAALVASTRILNRLDGERQAVIEQEAQSRKLLAQVLASVNEAIITLDSALQVQFINPAAEEMFGCRAAEVIGKPITRFVPDPHKDKHVLLIQEFGTGTEHGRLMGDQTPMYGQRNDGSLFPIETSISHTLVNGGKLYTVVVRDVTERNKAQTQLQYQANLLQNVSDAILATDSSLKFVSWNKAAERIYGWTAAEAIGKPAAELFETLYTGTNREAAIQKISETGEWQGEVRQRRNDGNRVDIWAYTRKLYDPNGIPIGYISVNRDISERKQAAARLEYQANLLQNVSDAIVATDNDLRIVSWNAAAEEIYGWTAAEAIGRNSSELLASEFYGDSRAEVIRQLEHGTYRGEARQKRKDGSWIEIQNHIRRLSDPNGIPIGYVSVNRDITNEQRQARALEKHSARALALADLSRALSEVGTDFRGVLDTAAERVTAAIGDAGYIGLTSDAQDYIEIVALDHRDTELATDLHKAVLGGRHTMGTGVVGQVAESGQTLLHQYPEPEPIQIPWLPADNELVKRGTVYSRLVVPLRVQSAIIGVLGVFRTHPDEPYTEEDRTFLVELAERIALAIANARLLTLVRGELQRRTSAEAEVRNLNTELEARVQERTAQLEAANRELESFSYSVSHDLRAPLRAIDGFARMLLRDSAGILDETGKHRLEVIRTNTLHMGALVDDLLAFSRLSRQELAIRPIEMNAVVNEAVKTLASERDGHNIDLEIQDLGTAGCDASLMRQVWVNLLGNALKYSRTRDPARIEIGCLPTDNEMTYFIRDNGVGFDMQYADKLFGVFQRLHRAEEYEGTGVGLAIVQRIICRHGGRVWAASQVDRGATFFFTLPKKSTTGLE